MQLRGASLPHGQKGDPCHFQEYKTAISPCDDDLHQRSQVPTDFQAVHKDRRHGMAWQPRLNTGQGLVEASR